MHRAFRRLLPSVCATARPVNKAASVSGGVANWRQIVEVAKGWPITLTSLCRQRATTQCNELTEERDLPSRNIAGRPTSIRIENAAADGTTTCVPSLRPLGRVSCPKSCVAKDVSTFPASKGA